MSNQTVKHIAFENLEFWVEVLDTGDTNLVGTLLNYYQMNHYFTAMFTSIWLLISFRGLKI